MKGFYLLLVFLFDNYAFAQGQDFSFPDDEIPRNVPISEQKCDEYNKPTGRELAPISLLVDAQPIKLNISKCNYDGIRLIVGGKPAEQGEFPFMAALGWRDDNNKLLWKCGGTLISERFVLTAAHCRWATSLGAPGLVRLGEHDLKISNDMALDFGILRIIKHPEHNIKFKYNDIALIELNSTVKFTKWIRPACIWNRDDVEQSTAVAAGWGLTDPGDINSGSDKLLKVKLNLIPNSECNTSYEDYVPKSRLRSGIVDSMICAGDLLKMKDTCQGDSGGPLFVTREGGQCKFYVVGITSFGYYCATQSPAVYTRVSSFIPWIEDIVW